MNITFYPRSMLVTAASLIALWLTMSAAVIEPERANVVMLVVSAIAYLALDVFFSINPALWRSERGSSTHT